jgi:hypothetical protein
MSKALSFDTITRIAFWLAFAAFLGASIPHIAYFFRSFDPIGGPEDRYWWAIAYAIAIGIDMTDFLLSMNVARLYRNKVSWRVLFNRWLFIIGITSFSWFVNWEYNVQFSSSMLSKVAEVSLFGLLRVGDLNPVLASMFQVLSIAYTSMAESLAEKAVEKTAEELEAEADERERKAKAQARIDSTRNQSAANWLKGKIGMLREVKNEVVAGEQNEVKQGREATVLPPDHAQQNGTFTLSAEEAKPAFAYIQSELSDDSKNAGKNEDSTEPNEYDAAWHKDAFALLERYPRIQSWLSTGQRTAAIEEIVDVSMQSKRKVINRVHDGTLKRSPRNAQLILISSVIDWLKTAPPPQQSDSMPRGQTVVKLVEKAG